MIWKEVDLIDVAEGKKAIQSSISPWSRFGDASRACDSKSYGNFAFHTGKEERCPWWIVDLEEEYFIECIKIKNSRTRQERIKTLKVELSQTGIEWTQVDAGLFMWENLNWATIQIEQKMKARYVKLSLNARVYFHLAKVQVFIRKYPGMILSGRLDAFCSKMTALINAKYLADKIGFKFGYSWVGYSTTVGDKVGVDVAYEEEVFDKNFIDNHSFTKEELKLHSNSLSFSSIKELTNLPFEYNWGWNCSKAAFLNKQEVIDLDEEEYRNEFRKIWNELPLSARYKEIIELVKSVIKKSLKEYIVIHIRNGDNIYEDKWRYSLFSSLIQSRIFPLEIVSALIGKHPDKNILLLGPDSNAIQELKNFHTQHRSLYTSAIVLQEGLAESERAFFDLMLMISAQKIYASSYSAYAEFASYVGGSEIIYINDLFSRKEQYKIILEDIDKLNTHFAQKSASLSYVYKLDAELKYNLEDKLYILKKGFEYKDNFCFAVEIIHLLFLNKKLQEADLFLKRIFKEKHMQDFLNVLFTRMPGRALTYQNYFREYTAFLDSNYAYINFIASQIKYLENDLRMAEKYLRKSLEISLNRYFIDFADKIGMKLNFLQLDLKNQELTQTKNQLDSTQKELDSKVKQMDSQIKNLESNQKQSSLKIQRLAEANQQLTQTNSQLNSKTKELDFTLHYGTAKSRIHNHLSYKLGETIIENSKSLLGYIRMPYVLSYIKDKHKQEQQQYQETIKKNPNLKLPNLESYPDYKESLKEKECFTYKLGEAFIKADKTWYKGGYVKLWFEVRRLKERFKQ